MVHMVVFGDDMALGVGAELEDMFGGGPPGGSLLWIRPQALDVVMVNGVALTR